MRKTGFFLALLLVTIFLFTPLTVHAQYSPDFDVNAKAVYMVDMNTGKALYEKNAHDRLFPASTTKIMTAILTLERIDDLDGTMITMKPYIEDTMYQIGLEVGGISLAGLRRGEEISARKLLYALMLPSANEAAMMLADYIGDGSVDYFAELMNEKAKEIGAMDTHFVNSNGLHDEDHYTTAYDLYLIADYAMKIPEFAEIVNTPYYNGGPTNVHETLHWNTTNKLLVKGTDYYYPYAKGIKTGSTDEAGCCLVTMAEKDGYRYMLVILGAPYRDAEGNYPRVNQAIPIARDLFEWAFSSFRIKTLIEKGRGVGEIPLRLAEGNKDHLLLMSGDRFTTLLPNEIEASSVILDLQLPQAVAAPVERGQEIGSISLTIAGEMVGSVPAVAAESAEASALRTALYHVKGWFRPFWVKYIIVFAVLSVITYCVVFLLRSRNRRRYADVRRRRKF